VYHPDVRLLILSARPELETNSRLVAAAQARGLELEVVDATRVVAEIGSASALRLGVRDLLSPRPHALLARVGNWRPDSVLSALEVATAVGVPTPNPAPAVRTGRDHWRTVESLAAAGLPVARTVAGADPESLAQASSGLGFPVVVKQRRSRMGVGVIRCDARDHLEAVLDSLWRVGDEVVVQRFVDTGGVSCRLLVVGDRVVASARFQAAPPEWRSNAARGGTATPYSPTRKEEELALAAARALGLGVCGVDLLPTAESAVVAEVNPTPGFRSLEQATGIDVAAAIVALLAGA